MKILVVSVSFPSPPRSGGERRLASLLDGLASRHELGMVTLGRRDPDPGLVKRLAFVDFVSPPPPRRTLPYPLGALQVWAGVLFGSLPGFARGSGTPAFSTAIARGIDRFAPEVAYVEPADVAHVVPAIKRSGVPVCFGAIEVVSKKAERSRALAAGAKQRIAVRRELTRIRRLEEQAFESADQLVCVSEEDRATIRAWVGRDPVVAPNGVDAGYFAPRDEQRDPSMVLAVGPLPYWANLDAVTWFARQVLPLLPDVRLEVVGRTTGAAYSFGPRVSVAGAVDDVRPYLARAAALVAPLRAGGGTRLKILEALAMGTPVVTTSIGAEGLDVRDGEHVLVADDAASFAAAVTRVRTDAALAGRLGRAGRELVVRHYGWRRSIDALEEALTRIARPASRTPS